MTLEGLPPLALLVVVALAVARAWRLAAVDDMPLLVSLRHWVQGTTIVSSEVTHHRRPWIAKLIECPWCLSVWLAPLALALARYSPGVAFWILGGLAVSELVGLTVRNLDPTED